MVKLRKAICPFTLAGQRVKPEAQSAVRFVGIGWPVGGDLVYIVGWLTDWVGRWI